jgi:hypothetical protein
MELLLKPNTLKQRGTEEIGGIKFFVLYEIKKSDSRLQDWFLNDNFPKSSSVPPFLCVSEVFRQ